MLVLAPLGDPPRTVLWTVTAVRKKSATMVAHLGYGSVTVTTTTVTLPNDWYSLTNDEVIEALAA